HPGIRLLRERRPARRDQGLLGPGSIRRGGRAGGNRCELLARRSPERGRRGPQRCHPGTIGGLRAVSRYDPSRDGTSSAESGRRVGVPAALSEDGLPGGHRRRHSGTGAEEGGEAPGEGVALLDLWRVAALLEDGQLRVRNQRVDLLGLLDRADPVVSPDRDERRTADAGELGPAVVTGVLVV